MSNHDNRSQGSQEAEEFDRFMFEVNNPRLFDEGNGAGGVGGGFDDDDDDYDDEDEEFELNRQAEEEELDSFIFDEDGEGDFDESGRAPDVNPYGDPDD
ncbi:hypothetical protein ACSZOF_21550 [Aeromonas veronii]|uniref:Uncharacterized protein n=1 Tax=Aeromonas veronii TaxID=654 RepID=A0AAX2UQ52_AERVE|nr:hypothetical protein [Aeromonas veronii]MBS4705243.1 hypothetical protein [Aeromonas veronii]TND51920.1 hypothetical protein CF123_18815 [Aeromonas veronii]BEE07120.1 hypothetical protein VAWG002_43160 [Aeromonas veronii]